MRKALVLDDDDPDSFEEKLKEFSDKTKYAIMGRTYVDLCSYRCVEPADLVENGFPGTEL